MFNDRSIKLDNGNRNIATLTFTNDESHCVGCECIFHETSCLFSLTFDNILTAILIVDDVQKQRDIATVILEELNYSVSSVQSGEGAVAYLKENNVGVLETNLKQKAIIVSGFSESERVKTVQ